jgi:uncharacterized protein YcbK (DUF882 family)
MGDLTKNLSRHEFACQCGCGFDTVDHDLPGILQEVADHFLELADRNTVLRVMIDIKSGNRCEAHNLAEGGSSKSRHMWGRAADFKLFFILHARDQW